MINAEPRTTHPEEPRRLMMDRTAGKLALVGAVLGIVAGLLDMIAGGWIRGWVGNKLDTSGLGLATVLLSGVALLAALRWLAPRGASSVRRLGTVLALVLVAGVCFTTIGRLWVLPAVLLLVAAAGILAGSSRGELTDAIDEHRWRLGLTAVLGAYYVFLGADALPKVAGFVGMVSGLVIWEALRVASRSHRLAVGLLVVGALAFAIVTFWSVVTPLIAVLLLTLGPGALRSRDGHERRSVAVPTDQAASRLTGSGASVPPAAMST